MSFADLLNSIPEVKKPKKRIGFNTKIIFTLVALSLYFCLSSIPLYGLSPDYVSKFETLSILLAAKFGSLLSLGIGPIVSGSIVLQLLISSEIIEINTNTHEGRQFYQGLQKVVNILFIVFENSLYVLSGALPPATPTLFNQFLIIGQLIIASLLIMFFDQLMNNYGFGSGISLFIAAGVSKEIFFQVFSPIKNDSGYYVGRLFTIIQLLIEGNPGGAVWPLMSIISTVLVFVIAIYAQSIKVNIPLTMGRVRGYNIKWPIKFIYTSVMPVIFTASLLSIMQMFGLFLFNMDMPILGTFNSQQQPISGFVSWLNFPDIYNIINEGVGYYLPQLIVYPLFMILGCIGFSVMWTYMGNQDAASVAEQIYSSGLSIPGFRRDKRVLERMLSRYINPLTVLGGITVGLVAVIADLLGALSRGTGILLTVMILYKMYEKIAQSSLEESNPLIKKFLGV